MGMMDRKRTAEGDAERKRRSAPTVSKALVNETPDVWHAFMPAPEGAPRKLDDIPAQFRKPSKPPVIDRAHDEE